MSQDTETLCQFFRWVLAELRTRMNPAEFRIFVRSTIKGRESDSHARSGPTNDKEVRK